MEYIGGLFLSANYKKSIEENQIWLKRLSHKQKKYRLKTTLWPLVKHLRYKYVTFHFIKTTKTKRMLDNQYGLGPPPLFLHLPYKINFKIQINNELMGIKDSFKSNVYGHIVTQSHDHCVF